MYKLIALAALLATSPAAAQSDANRSRMFKDGRERLALERVRGEVSSLVVIASREGQNGAVATEIARLGGRVEFRDDGVSYLFARVPTDRVEELSEFPWIEAADLDQVVPYEIGQPQKYPPPPEGKPLRTPPGKDVADDNPYLDASDTGAPTFRASHPTFDGRGVTVAILDAGLDPLLPELQIARRLEGKPVRKLADYLTTDEPDPAHHPGWVDMSAQSTARGQKAVYQGIEYKTPADRTYRIGVFRAQLPVAVPEGMDFGVLWEESTGTVWVDTNQNHDFTDEKPMLEYRYRQDIGVFGTEDPTKPYRGTFPFAVMLRPDRKYVRLVFEWGDHGSMTAGCAVGKNFFGSVAGSPAPEARVEMFVMTVDLHSWIKGMILAAKDPRVDVISMAIGGFTNRYPLADGRSTGSIIEERLIRKYDKLFIAANGNRFGMETINDKSIPEGALGVSAYTSKRIFEMNYGAEIAMQGMRVWTSGPGGAGALKPDVLVSSGGISTHPGWLPPDARREVFDLPVGYGWLGGTSASSCAALGAAAALISAARQSHVDYSAETLRRAIVAGARYVPEFGAYQQGSGVLDIPAAWEKLKALDGASFERIESSAPVKTASSDYLVPANRGPGIFERDGWSPGMKGERGIVFLRSSGSPRPVTYQLKWLGNNGTFQSAPSITLPLNRSVELPVSIEPKRSGVNSAILRLTRPGLAVPAYQLLNTVVAAEQFTSVGNYTIERTIRVNRPGDASLFVAVPENTPALRLDWDRPGRLDVISLDPTGATIAADYLIRRYNREKPAPLIRMLATPTAGVWEMLVDNWADIHRDFDSAGSRKFLPSSLRVQAAIEAIDIKPETQNVPDAKPGESFERELTFHSRYSLPLKPAVIAAIGSARSRLATISAGHQQIFDIQVPEGSTALSVRIGAAPDPKADLDLYLFDCTSGVCQPRGRSMNRGSRESVHFAHPQTGLWKVLVDAFNIPSGTATYDLVDFYSNPCYGSITLSDPPAGQSDWAAKAKVVLAREAEPGRFLQGFVTLVDESALADLMEIDTKPVPDLRNEPRLFTAPVPLGAAILNFEK